jgi:hypothetical protein
MSRSMQVGIWVLTAGLAVSGLSVVTACGGSDASKPKFAKVQAQDMPEGGEWTGVYYSPTYGYLHLVKEGTNISGRWKSTSGAAWGELHGNVTGDVLRYSWTQYKIGQVGAAAKTSGRGYFRYVVPHVEEGQHANDELEGQWGAGQSDAGNAWNAIKQRNMIPDPDSIAPDASEAGASTGGWDNEE